MVPDLKEPFNIAVAGVGGTGVLTIGALIGAAAHIEKRASMILDMAGLAQKGGAVLSHIRIATSAEEITSPRIVAGEADLLIAADDVVATSKESMVLCRSDKTNIILNTVASPVSDFVLNGAVDFKTQASRLAISKRAKSDRFFLNFTSTALSVTGDAIATNVMILGYAWQSGLIPLKLASLRAAIELNGIAVRANLEAFDWGRVAACDPAAVSNLSLKSAVYEGLDSLSNEEIIARRKAHLTRYQSAELASKYEALVGKITLAESTLGPSVSTQALARAVAINYSKLLSYKDEYETARLFTETGFMENLSEKFDGNLKISFNLAPPLLPGKDASGRPKKREFGSWVFYVFKLLNRMKGLRGTAFDFFGYTGERRAERRLIVEYEADAAMLAGQLTSDNLESAIKLMSLPDKIRGFGPVKHESMKSAAAERKRLLSKLDIPERANLSVSAPE